MAGLSGYAVTMASTTAALFGHRRVDGERHRRAPAAVVAGFDQPMRMNHDRLMHQLEAASDWLTVSIGNVQMSIGWSQ